MGGQPATSFGVPRGHSHNSRSRLALPLAFRLDDGLLMAFIEIVLILLYMCVLLIKSCDVPTSGRLDAKTVRAMCSGFGFGDTASGVFEFFVFFGLSLLALQLAVLILRYFSAEYVPKFVLIALSHSVAPSSVLARVCSRRSAICYSCLMCCALFARVLI